LSQNKNKQGITFSDHAI